MPRSDRDCDPHCTCNDCMDEQIRMDRLLGIETVQYALGELVPIEKAKPEWFPHARSTYVCIDCGRDFDRFEARIMFDELEIYECPFCTKGEDHANLSR